MESNHTVTFITQKLLMSLLFRQPTKKVPGPLGRGADRPLVQAVQVSGLISLAGAGEGGNSGMKLGQMVWVKAFSLGKYHKNVLHFKTF